MAVSSTIERTTRICELNDAFRNSFVGGVIVVTPGVEKLGPAVRKQLLQLTREFAAFDAAGDPHGEHDFGAMTIGDTQAFWKIDYYDRELQNGSEDPANPVLTTRVITIMLASEY